MLSVILPTRNRAALLDRTLKAMTRLQPPLGGWHLVVVDNGSSDSTAEVLQRYEPILPLAHLQCERTGMGAALNAALPHSCGDLAVKADDDLLPAPGWLIAYRDAADRHPEVTLFGGTTEPEWLGQLPGWLWTDQRALGVLYAVSTPPEGPCRSRDVYGPHWAIRLSVFTDGLRFSESIGPDASKPVYAMGCESELFGRLAGTGHTARHVAGARARHVIRPEQLTEAWILRRAFSCGLGAATLGERPRRRLRRLAYGLAARAFRPLPPSRLRLRIMFTDQLLAGMKAAGGSTLP